jgi:hypothetical protein
MFLDESPLVLRFWAMFPIIKYQYFGIFGNIAWTMGSLIALLLRMSQWKTLEQVLERIATRISEICC